MGQSPGSPAPGPPGEGSPRVPLAGVQSQARSPSTEHAGMEVTIMDIPSNLPSPLPTRHPRRRCWSRWGGGSGAPGGPWGSPRLGRWCEGRRLTCVLQSAPAGGCSVLPVELLAGSEGAGRQAGRGEQPQVHVLGQAQHRDVVQNIAIVLLVWYDLLNTDKLRNL